MPQIFRDAQIIKTLVIPTGLTESTVLLTGAIPGYGCGIVRAFGFPGTWLLGDLQFKNHDTAFELNLGITDGNATNRITMPAPPTSNALIEVPLFWFDFMNSFSIVTQIAAGTDTTVYAFIQPFYQGAA